MFIQINISVGDLVDRYTIAQVKYRNLVKAHGSNSAITTSFFNGQYIHLGMVYGTFKANLAAEQKALLEEEENNLYVYHTNLWKLEDQIRVAFGHKKEHGIISMLARQIHLLNDRRADAKNKVDKLFNSENADVKHFSTGLMK